MQFTPDETNKLKAMLLFLIKRKHKSSNGHSGFLITELNTILQDMVKDGDIELRPTINTNQYFLTRNNN